MKKFFRYCLVFITPFIGLLLLMDVISSSVICNNATLNAKAERSIWVLGHSHPQCAFHDSILPDMANFATSGESYYYTYFKTRMLLHTANQPSVVFIEFANNQITPRMNDWIWSDEHLSKQYSELQPFISYSDQLLLGTNNPKGFINAFALANRRKWERISRRSFDYDDQVGGYLPLRKSNIDSLLHASADSAELKWLDRAPDTTQVSESNVIYLQRLIDLLCSRNCKVYLVRSPLHKRYSGYENESTYQAIRMKHFSDVEFLDFSDVPLTDEEFSDFEHLNYRGAQRFSLWLRTLMEKGLLEQSDKRAFIDSYRSELP
jgi:hypothetical protein